MQDDELPEYVRDKVRKLRSQGDKSSRVGWWLGVVGVVAVGLVTAHVVSQQRREAAVAAGTPVVAQVKRMDSGDCFVVTKGFKCLRLTLALYPEGADSYTAELTQEIDLQWISRVQPGNWLTVSVARNDHNQVYFDERTMAVPPPTPR